MKALYKRCKNTGPGGMKCSCCRPLPSRKESAKYLNRIFRRVTKIKDRLSLC